MASLEPARLIEGEGTSELIWRRWLATMPCAELSIAEIAPSQRLVVVAPHPDDEVLACGGLVAMHAARGGEVMIVAVTEGEGSHADIASLNPRDLAIQRCAERLRGLTQLGLVQPVLHLLAIADGHVLGQRKLLQAQLSALLCPEDVVVTTWERDGHPDHDATGYVTGQACIRVGCRFLSAPVWMWHWATADDSRVPWRRLRRLTLTAEACLRKKAALAAHVTQLTPRSTTVDAVLGTSLLARAAWRHECYFV